MKAFAEVLQILGSETGTAEGRMCSVFQVSSFSDVHTKMDPKLEVVTMVRRLAQKEHSTAPSQLASRIIAVVNSGAGAGEQPFAEVKKLITDSINRLQLEASSDLEQ